MIIIKNSGMTSEYKRQQQHYDLFIELTALGLSIICYVMVLCFKAPFISAIPSCIILAFVLAKFYKAIKLFTGNTRYFIRSYIRGDNIEYIKLNYFLDMSDWTFSLTDFAILGYLPLSVQQIINYENAIHADKLLTKISKEEYTKYKLIEELKGV